MSRRFVVVSGLPGSGKSMLARQLASTLHLPLIDKDDILERLFASKGIGDAAWRRMLSRESDSILQAEAPASSRGAILVSFWRQTGMPADSGTPVDWLRGRADQVIHVHCACDPEIAARRFFQRQRHPGHLDGTKSYAEVLAGIRALADLEPLEIGEKVIVDPAIDTNTEPRLDEVLLLL